MRRYSKLSTAMKHIDKDVDRIKSLQMQIQQAQEEIERIKEEDSWLRYTGSDFQDVEDFDARADFYNKAEFIIYAE